MVLYLGKKLFGNPSVSCIKQYKELKTSGIIS